MKHTKGEWFPNEVHGIIIGVNAVIEKTEKGTYSQNVCEFILPDTDEEYEAGNIKADATLISAAPDLLIALEKTLTELVHVLHTQGAIWMPNFDDRAKIIDKNNIVVQARAALKKAKVNG